MALNTPKRIKLYNPHVQSPGSDHTTGDWPDSFDDEQSVNKNCASAVTNHSDATNSSTGICNGNGSLSPVSSCDSPEFSLRNNSNTSSNVSTNSHNNNNNTSSSSSNLLDARENRRGRPRSEALTTLMIEGSTSPSSIKCRYCNRVFPREKSLAAHLRTHTGERPYQCDYPGCQRAFTQSGQLKTHQRLHTGERPFMCSAPKCQMRFTHANRHCPEHPYGQLKRCDGYVVPAVTEQNFEVIKWLEKYKMEKEDRTPTRKTPKRTKIPSTANDSVLKTPSNENYNISAGSDENMCPITPNNPYKSRKGLMVELDMNAGLGASPITGTKMKPTPKVIRWHDAALSQEEDSADEFEMAAQSAFNPKKRWLREAWQNDLARPLDSIPNGRTFDTFDNGRFNDKKHSTPLHHQQHQHQQMRSPLKQTIGSVSRDANDKNQLNPNQLRPTVLMVASKDRTMPLVNLSPNVPLPMHKPHHDTSQSQSQTSVQPTSMQTMNQCQRHDTEHLYLDPKNLNASSTPIGTPLSVDRSRNNGTATTAADGTNRKWLGALALMELATDENNQVSLSMPLVYENSTTN